MWKRKRLPAALLPVRDGFMATLAEVEAGKEALAGVMPTTRLPGRPLPDALLEFEDRSARAAELMASWHAPAVEAEWTACDRGLAEARDRAKRFREDGPDLGGFEGLIWAVEQLMSPLESFEAAALRFRSLRTG
ncbi:MAG: hypothetical protein QOE83_1749 [Actinomycetota bacterium]|jgi:hypothetical protein|nr:hypothetical protein [Actinomycetota bacterium]